MTKTVYIVFAVDSFLSLPKEPKIVKCLSAVKDDNEETAELYEYTKNKRIMLIFKTKILKYRGLSFIQVLSQETEKYEKLKEVLLRNHVRGQYRTDPTKPFNFAIKKLSEIKI